MLLYTSFGLPFNLAPLAPLRGEGPGVRGRRASKSVIANRSISGRYAPSSPALLPRKAGGEGSQRQVADRDHGNAL
jgi:hypothetical protein